MAERSDEMVKVRWWWGRNRRKSARWAAEMRRQDEQRRIRHSTPTAYVLELVNNGPPHGWKWLCWDYDPDGARLMAGQVEGVLAPHGMKDGYATALDALTAGLGAIRHGGWTGDVVLREKAGEGQP